MAGLVPSRALAQSADDWKYQIGGRTTVMATTMHLSQLGTGFRDLPPGGNRLTHASSLFLLWRRGPHFRLGVETLVGNSYGNSDTGVLFQAAGITAEYQTTRSVFVALGAQAGAVIASATQPSNGPSDASPVRSGAYYKGSGLFLAPHVAVGRVFGRSEVRLVAKRVRHIPGTVGLDAFDSMYLGLSLGLRRR
jgi:hypothetical protein